MSSTNCVDTTGEAVVLNNDIPSAKGEAIARAKWAAIEQVVGIDIKAQSIVQNLMQVDDAISKEFKGTVSNYTVIDQKTNEGILSVRVNVCIEPTKAKDAVAGFARNNSISVFIPSRDFLGKHGSTYEETNIFSESIIGTLASQGYTVVDIAPTHVIDAQVIDSAIKSGRFMSLRTLLHKFLTNLLLIGKIDYTVSTRKGEDIGYGLAMPFNNITARLTYRLITSDASGNMVILAAGIEQGRGMAINREDAAAAGLQELTDKLTPVILEKVSKHIQGVTKSVTVKVSGVSELSDNFAIKDILQNTAWVMEVNDTGIGEFEVKYSENPIYLANSLEQKGTFKLVEFSRQVVKMKYIRQ
jgi:hypothetical protein